MLTFHGIRDSVNDLDPIICALRVVSSNLCHGLMMAKVMGIGDLSREPDFFIR
jgi:hypothetical protein